MIAQKSDEQAKRQLRSGLMFRKFDLEHDLESFKKIADLAKQDPNLITYKKDARELLSNPAFFFEGAFNESGDCVGVKRCITDQDFIRNKTKPFPASCKGRDDIIQLGGSFVAHEYRGLGLNEDLTLMGMMHGAQENLGRALVTVFDGNAGGVHAHKKIYGEPIEKSTDEAGRVVNIFVKDFDLESVKTRLCARNIDAESGKVKLGTCIACQCQGADCEKGGTV